MLSSDSRIAAKRRTCFGVMRSISQPWRSEQSYIPQAGDIPEFERYQASAREALDEAAYKTAWAEGQVMTEPEAVAYALEEPASD